MYKLYNSVPGRIILKLLTIPALSKAAGWFLDKRISRFLIPSFIRSNDISLDEVEEKQWKSFNDFFTRKLVNGAREIDMTPEAFVAPCDGLLTVHDIVDGAIIPVKNVPYTVLDLLGNRSLAKYYDGGTALVFRLTPSHYHRYVYPDGGEKTRDVIIEGVLHTVQPVATEATDVYIQNTRNYCVLKSENFGSMIFMQVGALLVGRIVNNDPDGASVCRGDEAGKFEFGGSTIIVLVKKGKVKIKKDIKKASASGIEYPVKLGMNIGKKK